MIGYVMTVPVTVRVMEEKVAPVLSQSWVNEPQILPWRQCELLTGSKRYRTLLVYLPTV